MTNWNWNLDELVDKVMSDLRKSDVKLGDSSVSAALTRDFRSIQSKKSKESEVQKDYSLDPLKGEVPCASKLSNEVFTLAERVIFSEIVCRYAAQTESKRWNVCSNVVITPSAKDELKKREIELVFWNKRTKSCEDSKENNDLKRDGVSCEKKRKSRVTISASNAIGIYSSFPNEVPKKESKQTRVFLANHLADGENFPLNVYDYLTHNASLTEARFTCLKEASRQIQNELEKDKSLKIILATHDGAIASIWNNRLSGVRAVVAFSYDQICYDLNATNANVVIVDPNRVGAYQFRRIVDYYLRSKAE